MEQTNAVSASSWQDSADWGVLRYQEGSHLKVLVLKTIQAVTRHLRALGLRASLVLVSPGDVPRLRARNSAVFVGVEEVGRDGTKEQCSSGSARPSLQNSTTVSFTVRGSRFAARHHRTSSQLS